MRRQKSQEEDAHGAREGSGYQGADLVVTEHVRADDGVGRHLHPSQMVRVAVRLAETPYPRARFQLDHRPQGEGLVNADLVQQRRVVESDGRDLDTSNLQAFIAERAEVHGKIVRARALDAAPAQLVFTTAVARAQAGRARTHIGSRAQAGPSAGGRG